MNTATLHEVGESACGFGRIVGRAPEMNKLYRLIEKAARSIHPVLILGESGTGKEIVAHAIHHSGGHSAINLSSPWTAVRWSPH